MIPAPLWEHHPPWQPLSGHHDHRLDLDVADGPRRTRARIVGEAIQAMLDEAAEPLADHGLWHAEANDGVTVGVPLARLKTMRARVTIA